MEGFMLINATDYNRSLSPYWCTCWFKGIQDMQHRIAETVQDLIINAASRHVVLQYVIACMGCAC